MEKPDYPEMEFLEKPLRGHHTPPIFSLPAASTAYTSHAAKVAKDTFSQRTVNRKTVISRRSFLHRPILTPTKICISILASILCIVGPTFDVTFAQTTTTTITSSGLGTTVTQSGNIYGITGGARVGSNLFHSFGDFTVGKGSVAQFRTNTLAPDATLGNILSRVTGGNPSSIYGTIDSASYYPNANLFLMNPAGIVFGPTASLNVGGSVAFSTADYLRLTDGVRFNAIPNATADALLSAAPVAAFGFLGSNHGAITVQGSQISVADGQSITLIGGDVEIKAGTLTDGTLQHATLSAPNGHIRLAGSGTAGEFLHDSLQAAPNIDGQTFSTYGVVNLSPGSYIDVSHGGTGTVSIRGGEFVLNVTNSILTTSAGTPPTPPEDFISLAGGSQILSSSTSGSDGAAIVITTGTLEVKGGSQIVSSNEGPGGLGGDITITATKAVTISGYDETATSGVRTDFGVVTSGVFAGTLADGAGGAITITTPKLTIEDSAEVASLAAGAGNGQAMTLNVGALDVTTGGRLSTISGWNYLLGDLGDGPGQAGLINIQGANSISVAGTGSFGNYSRIQSTAYGLTGGGSSPIEINAPQATVTLENGGRIETLPGFGAEPTGDISLTVRNLTITNGSLNSLGGDGRSGNISVNATGTISLSGEVPGQPFAINNENGGGGGTGIIRIETGNLALSNHARILNSTFSDPTPSTDAKISIRATDSVTMTDGSDIRVFSFLSGVGGLEVFAPSVTLSGHSTMNTFGQGTGNSGPITINTQNFSLTDGSTLNSSVLSGSSGVGGPITIQGLASPAESMIIDGSGSGIFTDTKGAGTGGNIVVNANTVTLQNGGTLSAKSSGTDATANGGSITINASDQITMTGGATITAGSTGPGNAGNIFINAGQQLEMHDSSIKTEAAMASGGNIDIRAVDRVSLVNSMISTSVLGGSGSGGNITIDPTLISLANSSILAQAILGSGGNIRLVAGLLLVDPSSVISASSEFGQSGTIQSPTSNLAGTVSSLPSSTRQGQALQAQRCAVLNAGGSSSFIIAGRDQVPTEPGGWMVSSIDALATGEGSVARGKGEGLAGSSSSSGLSSFFGSRNEINQNNETNQIDQIDQMDQSDQTNLPPVLSLRRLTPAGFLTQHFAESEESGCRS